jgi:hypothetical protein
MKIRSLEELTTPDERTLRFTPMGLGTGGMLNPEYAAEFQQRVIEHCDLHSDVSENTRNSFERLRTLHSYGVLCYEAFTVAHDLARLVMEQALRDRFIAHFSGVVPLVGSKGEEKSITADNFEAVDQAFRRGGSHSKGTWRLKLSTGPPMVFRGGLSQLQDWARREHFLDGQRNKRLDPFYVAMRNSVAHPRYHVSMPPDSARTIRDLAEIINRLWGHYTPGGRLYPAPLDQQVLIVAWSDGELGPNRTILRDYQLSTFNDPGEWMCVVIRAVFDDEGIWDFDAEYERTNLPCELLFGPSNPDDALAWLNKEKPVGKTVKYLDRLFALRIHGGKASVARRPEVALALPPERRAGRWFVVRADFPGDAFAHVRHIKNGVTCGDPNPHFRESQLGVIATAPPIPSCAVEDVLEGDWEHIVDGLVKQFGITEPAELSQVRVPARWAVAPDVEAE